jgi:hypothetical protein
MAYDHPAYTAVRGYPTGQLNGSAGVSTKYAAFTTEIIKSVTLAATTINTSADVVNVLVVRTGAGTNTTTTTTAYGTMGSAAFFGNFTPAAASQVTVNQGDTWWVQKGTDATGTYVGSVEVVTSPLANVTI